MSNSSLVSDIVDFGTKNSNERKNQYYNPSGKVTKITIHHMAMVCDAVSCAKAHRNKNSSSANYYIGNDGKICLGVDESRRAWTSDSKPNDYVAVTIEVSNSQREGEWPISDAAYKSLVALCADICKRNGIEKLNFTGDINGNLTMHKYFVATVCPGPYLESRFAQIANEVNAIIAGDDPAPQPKTEPIDVTKYIWDYLTGKIGLTEYATAGFMGNWQEESGFKANNLQNTFNSRFGVTDEEYTSQVDNGTRSENDFIHDSAGYGLSQWTFWSRKQGLYLYIKGKNASIGDLDSQLEYVGVELSSSKTLRTSLMNAKSVREASDIVLHSYEKPSDQSEQTEIRRAKYGQVWYDKYSTAPKPEPSPSLSQDSFLVRVSTPYLNIRTGPGTNYPITGKYTGVGVFTIVETSPGEGSKKGWGKLKSEAGWISLDFAERI